jgi:mannose-6-phosphate isomerase-like protein (cupin superfamily)
MDIMSEASIERAGEGSFPYLLHEGTSPVSAQWYFREETRLPVAVHRWVFPPGATEGNHIHPADGHGALDELYLLVGGRATMTLGERTVEMTPGDALLAPAGVEHGVRNEWPDPAEFVVVWGPPDVGLDWSAFGTGRAAADAARSRPEGR